MLWCYQALLDQRLESNIEISFFFSNKVSVITSMKGGSTDTKSRMEVFERGDMIYHLKHSDCKWLSLDLVYFDWNQHSWALLPFSCLFRCWNHKVCKHILHVWWSRKKDNLIFVNLKFTSFLSKFWHCTLLENFRSSKTVSNEYFDVINEVV